VPEPEPEYGSVRKLLRGSRPAAGAGTGTDGARLPSLDRGGARSHSWRRSSLPFVLLGLLILLTLGLSIGMPSTFGTASNLKDIVSSEVLLLALTMAVSFPLRAGDFDLSMASNMVLSGAASIQLLNNFHVNEGLAFFAGILIGLLIGVINGVLVVGMRMDAFVITLATQTIAGALAFGITGSNVVSVSSGFILSFARSQFLGLQAAVWYTWILAAIVWYVFEFTPYGRRLLFCGGNRASARLAGVRVNAVRASAFAICGLIAGFAGVLMAGTFGAVDPTSAGQFLLQPYAAVFLGTTAIQLGRVNVLGSVIGLYLLAVGVTGLELLGVSSWVGDLFNGVALLLALGLVRAGGFVRD
jgi:ribose transport system permease protein